MIVAFKSHVFITGREFIEQLLRILWFSMRQATHFIGQRLSGKPRPLLVDLLCSFVEHEFCEFVGSIQKINSQSEIIKKTNNFEGGTSPRGELKAVI